jgi:hypothetical protein
MAAPGLDGSGLLELNCWAGGTSTLAKRVSLPGETNLPKVCPGLGHRATGLMDEGFREDKWAYMVGERFWW